MSLSRSWRLALAMGPLWIVRKPRMSLTRRPRSRGAGASFFCAVLVLSLAWACDSAPPTTPSVTPSVTPGPSSPGPTPPSFTRYQLSGRVTDEVGSAIAGAIVEVDYNRGGGSSSSPPSLCPAFAALCWLATQTNGSGEYKVELEAGHHPHYPGAIGYVYALHEGHEPNIQMVPAGTPEIIQDLRMRSVRALTAGESIAISVEPDSSRCSDLEDLWVLSSRCEVVQITTDTAGTLLVEARAADGGSAPTMFWATTGEYAGVPQQTGPGVVSIPVRGGTYRVFVGTPAGLASRRFDVVTSLR